jgi:ornithine decarboxylase
MQLAKSNMAGSSGTAHRQPLRHDVSGGRTQEQPLVNLASTVGAIGPRFMLSTEVLLANLGAMQECFPGATVAYAMKANPHPLLLETLSAAGCSFEAASWDEIELLLSLGVGPEQIIFGTAVKPRVHVLRAASLGIDCFAADSEEELHMLAAAAPGRRAFIRIKGNDSHSVFKMGVKFGAPPEAAVPLLLLARNLGLVPWGLSFNVGSNAGHAGVWAQGVAMVRPLVEELLKCNLRIEALNIGGGFPALSQAQPTLEAIAHSIARELATLPYPVALILEPGRALAASCLSLHAQVIRRVEREDGSWLFLDVGVYNALFEALSCQGSTRYPVRAVGIHSGAPKSFVLAGPTGDGLDIIARSVRLPGDLGEGSELEFLNAGAYTSALASTFNGFPVPPTLRRA